MYMYIYIYTHKNTYTYIQLMLCYFLFVGGPGLVFHCRAELEEADAQPRLCD